MSKLADISVVLPTYSRSGEIARAVESALQQTADPSSYEVIVVDNNSTDGTAAVVDDLARQHAGRLRYVREERQGVAYARNAGIEASRAPVVAFFDDDVRVAPDWVETIRQAFSGRVDLDCVGGRVLPDWVSPPPPWLTRAHWAPLALQDFGDEPFTVSAENPKGLISANLACRKEVFERVGGFSPSFQRVKDVIGSLEDDEWIRRFWKADCRALYVPELITYTAVPSARLTRAYHRRWHSGHGRFYALMRAEEMERTSLGSLFGVPAHVYRSALLATVGWIAAAGRGRIDQAFTHEVRLRFLRGFIRQRLVERLYS